MTTTTMHLSQQRMRGHIDGASVGRRSGRPLLDLSGWVAPLIWMVALATIVSGLGVLALSREGIPSEASATISVRVSPSDTLWSIATANRLPGSTTAATVQAIARVNGLHDSRIVSGTTLRVPSATAPGTAFAQADETAAAH